MRRLLPLLSALLLLCQGPWGQAAPPALWVPPTEMIPPSEPPPKGFVPAPGTMLPLSASASPLGPAAGPAATAAPERKRRARVTVFPTSNPQVPDASAVAVLRSLSESLRRNERLDMKDLDVRLSDFAQEVPVEQVDLARQTFQKGQEALERRDHSAAIPQLEDAIDQLAQVLPYVKKQELADAQLALALAQLRSGNRRSSSTTLTRLMTWRPEYEPDPGQFPVDEIRGPLEAARQAVGRAEHGQLQVNSDPPGAQVFVDGVFLGVTPAVASDLLVGEHYITYKKLGFKKALRIAQVSARGKSSVQAKLARSEKFLLVKQAMDKVTTQLGGQQLDPVVDNLKETLFLDHGVFLRLAPLPGERTSGERTLVVTVDLYDLRSRRLLSQKTAQLPPGVELDSRVAQLATALYAGIDYEGRPKMTEDPPAQVVVPPKPLYKRWWFLATVGALLAGSAAAVAVGVTLTRPAGCPGDHTCTGPISY